MIEFKCNPVGCGLAHTAAIGVDGRLFVWGENRDGSLQALARDEKKGKAAPYINLLLTKPEHTGLGIKERDKDDIDQLKEPKKIWFNAMSVACGHSCTFVIGYKKKVGDLTFLSDVPEECKELMKPLLSFLKKGQLLNTVFQNKSSQKQNEQDSYDIQITNKEFVKKMIDNFEFSNKITNLEKLGGLICNHSKKIQPDINDGVMRVGDIEDIALGYVQSNVKLFALGQLHDAQKAVDSKHADNNKLKKKHDKKCKELEDQKNKDIEKTEGDEEKIKKVEKIYKNDLQELENQFMVESQGAVVIKFPILTRPIVSVSVGFQHCLALSSDCQMYSWGSGSYIALGFPKEPNGNQEDVKQPRKLVIYNSENLPCEIIQICCGSLHSMCLTRDRDIYSWGEGSYGRLGHDASDKDVPTPKEIYTLSKRSPIAIAAGEAHSAAITESHQLFTWGQGGFGRLGHGPDPPINRNSPKLVEDLEDINIVDVSLGGTHSIAVTKQGEVYTFGQNNYGKLGLGYKQKDQIDSQWTPIKIFMHKLADDGEPSRTNSKIVRACAGNNHSVAISSHGKTFTWGYGGKGLLGRATTYKTSEKQKGSVDQQMLSQSKLIQSSETSKIAAIVSHYDKTAKKPDKLYPLKVKQGYDDPSDEKGQFVKQQMDKVNKGVGINHDDIQLNLNSKIESCVVQLATGSNNTVALTNQGDIFVFGDFNHMQHLREKVYQVELDDDDQFLDNQKFQEKYERKLRFDDGEQGNISLITIKQLKGPGDKVNSVACGAGHIFAQTSLDCIYGWGRNDQGQVGVGFLSDKLSEPTMVQSLSFKGCKQLCCGDDYSAAVTVYGGVFVTGSVEFGKLGLGKGLKGFQLDFFTIPGLPAIDSIAGGPSHMLACSKSEKKTYAWGQNHKGQLGIGNNTQQYTPVEVKEGKEKFKALACGASFSLGLSESNKVYHWGNLKYSLNDKDKTDILEPKLIEEIEKDGEVRQVAASNKIIIILLEDGSYIQWGEFLLKKSAYDDGVKKHEDEKIKIEKRHREKKQARKDGKPLAPKLKNNIKRMTDQRMQSVSVSYNHACAISKADEGKQKAYSWGHNNYHNRLGVVNIEDENKARIDGVETLMKSLTNKMIERDMDLIKELQSKKNELGMATQVELGSDQEDQGLDNSYDKSVLNVQEEEKEGNKQSFASKTKIQNSQLQQSIPAQDQDEVGNTSQKKQPQDDDQSQIQSKSNKNESQSKFSVEFSYMIDKFNQELNLNNEIFVQIDKSSKNLSDLQNMKAKEKVVEEQAKQVEDLKDLIILAQDKKSCSKARKYLALVQQGDSKVKKQYQVTEKFVPDLNIFDQRVAFNIFEYLRQAIEEKCFANISLIWHTNYEIPLMELKYDKMPISEELKPYKLLDASKQIQDMLQKEGIGKQKYSEKVIVARDKEIRDRIHSMLETVFKSSLIYNSAQQWTRKASSSLQARLEQQPFGHLIDREMMPSLFYKGMQPEILKLTQDKADKESNKCKIKQILTLLNLHPCYLANILKMGSTDKFDLNEQQIFIKQLYGGNTTSETARNNSNLLYVFEELLVHDIGHLELQEVDLTRPGNEMMSVYLFKRIFKSDNANIDTVASIYCSIVNIVEDKMGEQDYDFDGSNKEYQDTKNSASKDSSQNAKKDPKKKSKHSGSRMKDEQKHSFFIDSISDLLKKINKDEILEEQGKLLQTRKKIENQQNHVKDQIKEFQIAQAKFNYKKKGEKKEAGDFKLPNREPDGLDDEDVKKKYPSLKFSSEASQLIKILVKVLRSLPYSMEHEAARNQNEYFQKNQLSEITNFVAMQVLGLIFAPLMRQINENMELYVLPYVQKAHKMVQINKVLEDHQQNIKNMVQVFLIFLTERIDIPEIDPKHQSWTWAAKLFQQNEDFDKTRIGLFDRICNCGSEIDDIRGYKNLEKMVFHSLEKEKPSICISKKVIGKLFSLIKYNQKEVSILNPPRNDLLIKLISTLKPQFIDFLANLQDDNYNDQMIVKLKTRLFHADTEEVAQNPQSAISKIVRCIDCNAILTKDLVECNFEESLTISEAKIQDPSSLSATLSAILKEKREWIGGKLIEDIDKSEVKQLMKKHEKKDEFKILNKEEQEAYEKKTKQKGKDSFYQFMRQENLKGFYHFLQIQQVRASQDKKSRSRYAAINHFLKKSEVDVKNKLGLEYLVKLRKQRQNPTQTNDSDDKDAAKQKFIDDEIESKMDQYIWEIIHQIEIQMNKRIQQQFDLDIIEKSINSIYGGQQQAKQSKSNSEVHSYKIDLMINDFINKVIPYKKQIVFNYSYGLANKDFVHMTRAIVYRNQVEQMQKVIKYVEDLGASKDLMKLLPGKQKQKMGGYLCVDAQTLLNNKTINDIKLQELRELMPKSQFIFIADSQGNKIEFKVIFKDDENNIQDVMYCRPKKVTESELLKVILNPRELIELKNKIAKKEARKALNIVESDDSDEDKDQVLIFPQNDAIIFNSKKFFDLINQMELQSIAYMIIDDQKKSDNIIAKLSKII